MPIQNLIRKLADRQLSFCSCGYISIYNLSNILANASIPVIFTDLHDSGYFPYNYFRYTICPPQMVACTTPGSSSPIKGEFADFDANS